MKNGRSLQLRNDSNALRSRERILQCIHQSNGLAAVEISRLMQLNPASVKHHVEHLIKYGKIRRAEHVRRGPGRPMSILKPNPDSGYTVGVDMDLSQVTAVVTDMARNVLASVDAPIRQDADGREIVELLVDAANRVVDAADVRKSKVLGVGFAVSGFYDREAGVVVMSKSLPGWKDVPVRYLLEKSLKYPVHVDNSVQASLMAEKWFGHGLGVKNFLVLHVRTGVGVGVVINGEPYLGLGNAGTVNDFYALPLRAECKRDRPCTLLELASGHAILRRVRDKASAKRSPVLWEFLAKDWDKLSLDAISEAARNQDPLCLSVLTDAARCWGRVLSRLIELLHPEKVILTGTFSDLAEALQSPLMEGMDEGIYPALRGKVTVEFCELGKVAGALGAAAMVVRHAIRS
jgi:N-acetylglucosamine repressor